MTTLSSIAVPVTRKKVGGQSSRTKQKAPAIPGAGVVSRTPRGTISPNIRDAGHRLKAVERLHKFTVGQTVTVTFNPIRPASVGTTFKVVHCMPVAGPSLQYRVRSDDEPYERVVLEEDLLPFDANGEAVNSEAAKPITPETATADE